MKYTPGRARFLAAVLVIDASFDVAVEPHSPVVAVLALGCCVLAGGLMWFANHLAYREPEDRP